ncbi:MULTISPECIES: hypothetical protein [unclassified Microcoleus]|nr:MULTISPECIES: hypothetical protein [unclassified Microcoleus]
MRSTICQIVDRAHRLTSDIVGLIFDTILGARYYKHEAGIASIFD